MSVCCMLFRDGMLSSTPVSHSCRSKEKRVFSEGVEERREGL